MDLFRRACQQQGWTIGEERGLKGWTDATCSAGHEFRVVALDVVSEPMHFGRDPSLPWCRKCRTASWVAECLAVLTSAAKDQGIELTATDEEDESGDGHVVFAASCSKGHHFTTTGRNARDYRGQPVEILCQDCSQAAAYAEGFAKLETVVQETRSTIVKRYRNAAEIRCRRGHPHTFYVDSWDGRQAIRSDFCSACKRLARFQEFSDRAKDLGITVLESQWIGVSRPHQAVCFAGHEVGLVPNKIKRGCPACPRGMYGGSVPPHDVYYVVSGLDGITGEETVKPGISSGGGYNRLRQHAEDGLSVQHLRIAGLPRGMARLLERYVLDGLDREGWLSTRGLEYFPAAALQDVLDFACEWFTDQAGLAPRSHVVEADDVLDAVASTPVPDIVDIDAAVAVIFDSQDTACIHMHTHAPDPV
ncbi:hypothetical protein AB0G64_34695 [Streptomyces longwoodensis]|uniref:hypothetical protein n=1 Tax=Streptomyces longwoodensis TaxID=68231 RepID=UPI0033EB0DE0